MKRRPTIHDVAARAGVSKSTVSLVLQSSGQVRAETAELVRHTMADMGYVYNRAAANLRSGAMGLVGLIINDLRNPFFTEFAVKLQMTLAARGYATVISNSAEDPALQAALTASMIEHGVTAMVISPTYDNGSRTFDQIAQAGLPTLQVLRQMDERLDLFPFSSFDYATGSALAAKHLVDLGARRVAFVGGFEGRAITHERMSGYIEALNQEGITPFTLHGRPSRAFGMTAADTLLAQNPKIDAAICFNDLVAFGVMAGYARAGRCIGSDLRLVGFDDIEDCAQVWPQLSSVACDIAQFAQDTAQRLCDWMIKGCRPAPVIRAPVSLVPRASSTGVIL